MEYILTQLRRNGVVMNEQVFRREMNKIINEHEQMYEQLADRSGGEDDLMMFFIPWILIVMVER